MNPPDACLEAKGVQVLAGLAHAGAINARISIERHIVLMTIMLEVSLNACRSAAIGVGQPVPGLLRHAEEPFGACVRCPSAQASGCAAWRS